MKKMYFCSITQVYGDLGMTRRKNSGDMLAVISVFEMLIVLLPINNHCLFQWMIPLLGNHALEMTKLFVRFSSTTSQSTLTFIQSSCSPNCCKNNSRRWRREIYWHWRWSLKTPSILIEINYSNSMYNISISFDLDGCGGKGICGQCQIALPKDLYDRLPKPDQAELDTLATSLDPPK